jgi:organic radical activating enzyme
MLRISEQFYSIQGEGIYTGCPAIFLRLTGCNLLCGGEGTIESKSLENKASWRCDTIEVWTKGNSCSYDIILQTWESNGWMNAFKQGAHLIITGGEPLLQQDNILEFLNVLKNKIGLLPTIEIETNGTIVPRETFLDWQCHFNVSPKISNSGMPLSKCLNPESIIVLKNYIHSSFKCVISKKDDINEYIKIYINPYQINPKKVLLMPAADNAATLKTVEEPLINYCKDYGFRYSTRLHIAVWNKKTGV